tara:strand:+ start:580 stop:1131 length:552 start_codon:yes stop_codon:yes gene_type:complete
MVKYKKEVIDVKKLDEITPPQWRDKINLLFNKDIPKTPNTPDELVIYNFSKKLETKVQQQFYTDFNTLARELKFTNNDIELEFVQNDNGGNMGIGQKVKKKAEGSQSGFPDASLFVSNVTNQTNMTMFCEVKKIGSPSEIHLTKEQFDWFIKLNRMGFDAYITNNPIFFRRVILNKIRQFYAT